MPECNMYFDGEVASDHGDCFIVKQTPLQMNKSIWWASDRNAHKRDNVSMFLFWLCLVGLTTSFPILWLVTWKLATVKSDSDTLNTNYEFLCFSIVGNIWDWHSMCNFGTHLELAEHVGTGCSLWDVESSNMTVIPVILGVGVCVQV